MKNITLPGAIVIGCCVVGIAVVASQLLKQSSIEKQQEVQISAERAAEYREKQEEMKEAETLTSNRANCLYVAKSEWESNLRVTAELQAECDLEPEGSIQKSACMQVITEGYTKDKTTYESAQQLCYDRYPTTN